MSTSLRVAALSAAVFFSIGCNFLTLDDEEKKPSTGGKPGSGGAGVGGSVVTTGGTGGSTNAGGMGGSSGVAGTSPSLGGSGPAGMGGMGGTAGMAGTPAGGMAGGGAPTAGMAGDTATGGMAGSGGTAGSASGAGGGGPVTCASLNSGSKAHAGHCYLLVTSTVNWNNAKSACTALGAHLVTISSESPLTQAEFDAENDFVFNELGGSKDTWIGLSDGLMDKDSSTSGTFKWVNDEPLTLDKWNDNEPNHYGKDCMDGSDCFEHCVFMMMDPAGNWNDELCEATKQYVCEWDEGG